MTGVDLLDVYAQYIGVDSYMCTSARLENFTNTMICLLQRHILEDFLFYQTVVCKEKKNVFPLNDKSDNGDGGLLYSY